MEQKRFAVEQIIAILKQAELGIPIAEGAWRMTLNPPQSPKTHRESAQPIARKYCQAFHKTMDCQSALKCRPS
jgi:hypothetical protein